MRSIKIILVFSIIGLSIFFITNCELDMNFLSETLENPKESCRYSSGDCIEEIKETSQYSGSEEDASESVSDGMGSELLQSKNKHVQSIMSVSESSKIVKNIDWVYQILETDDKDAIASHYSGAVHIVNELSSCLLEEDICGQREALEKMSDYLNPHRTPLHQIAKASLKLAIRAIADGYGSIRDIDKGTLKSYLTIKSNELPILSAQILIADKRNIDENYNLILDSTSQMESDVKVNILLLLSAQKKLSNGYGSRGEGQPAAFVEELKRTVSNSSDTYTALQTLKYLSSFRLSNSEFTEVSKQTCLIKSDLEITRSWSKAYQTLQRQSKRQGVEFKLSCP